MSLPLSTPRPGPLAVAPPVVGLGALGLAAGLLWIREQLAKKHFQESVFMNDYQADALYRQPNYQQMTGDQLLEGKRLLDHMGTDSHLMQPGSVMLERSKIDAELMRRSGSGGFIFIAPPESPEALPGELIAGALAAAVAGAGGLLKGGQLIGQGLGKAADQLWGLLNGGPETVREGDWYTDGITSVGFPAAGTFQARVVLPYSITRIRCDITQYTWTEAGNSVALVPFQTGVTGWEMDTNFDQASWDCGATSHDTVEIRHRVQLNGVWQPWQSFGQVNGYPDGTTQGIVRREAYIDWVKFNGQDYIPMVPATDPRPRRVVPGTSTAAPAVPRVAPTPAYLPKAPPVTEPVEQPVPETAPGGQPSPVRVVPAAPPQIAPQRSLSPVVPRLRRLVVNGNAPEPTATPKPQPTPEAQEIPWPGAAPIQPNPLAPPPTPEGIARKLGALEGKLDQIGKRQQDTLNGPSLVDLLQLLGNVLNLLQAAGNQGMYLMNSPCNVDASGEQKPDLEAPWAGSTSMLGVLSNKLDALAQHMYNHKTLPGPCCKGPAITGEFVTVQFEET